ncbi:TLC domain-containing protein 2-like [Acanthaster planci]|uniref:TLC domain-containing protein 2-like n=1 Tax=Acanthaster planci TaxID=133434 RepID=A0A8B7YSK3_ACAPL|nr:TLC domain-containing protein 2-like [Acanthaster planci]
MTLLLLSIVAGSALAFQSFNRLLDRLPMRYGPCGKYSATDKHKWRNAATSLLNSFVLSVLVSSCFYWYPELWSNMVYYCTRLNEITFAVLVGYYMYDLHDLVSYNKFSAIWPLLGHHLTGSFLLTLVQRYQQGMGVVLFALFCEVNAVFLHLRQLLLMHGVARQSLLFRVVKIVNLATFVVFRLIPMVYSGYCSVAYDMATILAIATPMCNVAIVTVNVVLFRRVVYNDFIRRDNNNKSDEAFIMDR